MTDLAQHVAVTARAPEGPAIGRLYRQCEHCGLMTNYHADKRDMFREWKTLSRESPRCNGHSKKTDDGISLPPEQMKRIGKDYDLPNNPEKTAQVMRVRVAQLDKLLKASKISTVQFEAGERLRRHHERGSLTGSNADYSPRQAVDTSPNPDSMRITDVMIDNQRAFYSALDVLESRQLPFVNFLILDMPISETGFPPLEFLGRTYCGWRNKPQAISGATDTVRAILDRLVNHFGLIAQGGGEGRMRYFGERPDMFTD